VVTYTTKVLQDMKKNHEAKILKLISGSNILITNPSALNIIVGFVGNRIFDYIISDEPTNAPNTEDKILYNNVILFKPLVEEYAVYQGKLNKLYEEIEKQGSTKKNMFFRILKPFILKKKGIIKILKR
jgi:hypothetical protein